MRTEESIADKLWSRFKGGDKNAFASIYALYSNDLISYGSRICHDLETLKDAIQDLFMELWHSKEQLAQVECVKFYLFKALRYKLIRTAEKRHQHHAETNYSSNPGFNRFEISSESVIIDREIHESQVNVLRKAIKSLSKRQQEVIQLRFYQGFTIQQIAELMQMNCQSVSNLTYTSLCRIKKNLKTSVFAVSLVATLSLFF